MILRAIQLGITILGITVLMSGCSINNGLPQDVTAHLAAHGISAQATGFHAPLSSRAGYIVFAKNSAIESQIINQFDLEKIKPENRLFNYISGQVAEQPIALWGKTGRPANLKLKNGAQFEYLFLMTTAEDRIYLFAEYAYG